MNADWKNEVQKKVDQALEQLKKLAPPISISELVEKNNIQLLEVVFDDPNLSGAIKRTEEGFKIFVNAHEPLTRKRFTIAHELGHFFLEDFQTNQEEITRTEDIFFRFPPETPSDKTREVKANYFAACLLMPSFLIKEFWEITRRDLQRMADFFLVSELAMGIRLEELGLWER